MQRHLIPNIPKPSLDWGKTSLLSKKSLAHLSYSYEVTDPGDQILQIGTKKRFHYNMSKNAREREVHAYAMDGKSIRCLVTS